MEKMTFDKACNQYELYIKDIASYKKLADIDGLKETSIVAYEYYQERLNSLKNDWNEFYKEIVHIDERHVSKTVYKYWKGYEISRNTYYGIGISN
jgi:hypothetical protein